jgi:hypothetical protein
MDASTAAHEAATEKLAKYAANLKQKNACEKIKESA